jgi:integrase
MLSSSGAGADQLWLFDCGGVDVGALKVRRDSLRGAVRAGRTVSAYESDWRQFDRWCRLAGRASLPSAPESLELYVTWMLTELGRKVSTAERHVSAIAHRHRLAGLLSPVAPCTREVIRGVRRQRRERPVGKRALSPSDLVRVARRCDAGTALGARDRAIVVLGFATTFRRTELARLQLSDVSFERRGLAVLLRYSKRDQDGKGRLLGVWAGRRACTDPVRVLRGWLAFRGDWDGPLFCRVQTGDVVKRRSISGEALNEVVKRRVACAGIDSSVYGAHSLRAGAITASAELGRSDQEIMGLSGHASPKVMKMYVRSARLFAGRNPLAGVL